MIARLRRVNFLAKKKDKNIHRQIAAETLENDTNHEIIRFQGSNITSTLKGYLFQTAKLWKELIELTET